MLCKDNVINMTSVFSDGMHTVRRLLLLSCARTLFVLNRSPSAHPALPSLQASRCLGPLVAPQPYPTTKLAVAPH